MFVSGPEHHKLDLVDKTESEWDAVFVLRTIGSYQLDCLIFGAPIPNQPFHFDITPAETDPEKCTAAVPALVMLTCGATMHFVVTARDQFGNKRDVCARARMHVCVYAHAQMHAHAQLRWMDGWMAGGGRRFFGQAVGAFETAGVDS